MQLECLTFFEMLQIVRSEIVAREKNLSLDPKKINAALVIEIEEFRKLESSITKLMQSHEMTF